MARQAGRAWICGCMSGPELQTYLSPSQISHTPARHPCYCIVHRTRVGIDVTHVTNGRLTARYLSVCSGGLVSAADSSAGPTCWEVNFMVHSVMEQLLSNKICCADHSHTGSTGLGQQTRKHPSWSKTISHVPLMIYKDSEKVYGAAELLYGPALVFVQGSDN